MAWYGYVGLYLAFFAAAIALGAVALTTIALATDRNLTAAVAER